MSTLEALILGIIQGLTEFLPVSSSGHLEIGHAILGIENSNSLLFAVIVHGATVLSTIIIFRNEIFSLLKGLLEFRWNHETQYVLFLLISAIPVVILGLFFKETVENLYSGNIIMVGAMLILTSILLALSFFARKGNKELKLKDVLIIGIIQAFAVIPGISRSGSTIAVGLLLGNRKSEVTRFSFLMVLAPIAGANLMDLLNADLTLEGSVGILPLIIGFFAAFISGLVACRWMIKIVQKGKLIYFAAYCLVIGLIAIFAA